MPGPHARAGSFGRLRSLHVGCWRAGCRCLAGCALSEQLAICCTPRSGARAAGGGHGGSM
jgi:hypothetical protein